MQRSLVQFARDGESAMNARAIGLTLEQAYLVSCGNSPAMAVFNLGLAELADSGHIQGMRHFATATNQELPPKLMELQREGATYAVDTRLPQRGLAPDDFWTDEHGLPNILRECRSPGVLEV